MPVLSHRITAHMEVPTMAMFLLESPLFIVPPDLMLGHPKVDQYDYMVYEALYNVAESQLDSLTILANRPDTWKAAPHIDAVWRMCIKRMAGMVKEVFPSAALRWNNAPLP